MPRTAADPLFEPTRLGELAIPNRLVMAPMTRNRAFGATPHKSAALYYAQRAGAGLIVSEGVCITAEGAGAVDIPGLWSGRQVDAWRQITSAVHSAGGRIVAQLWHLGRAGLPDQLPDRAPPVGPSAVPIDPTTYVARRPMPYVTPEPLTVRQIEGIAHDFATAAENARGAGFDGVELHGANGYLIDQFLHSSSNRRDDEYGGEPHHRARFLVEMAEAVCGVWGSGRVGIRLSPSSTFQDMHDPDPRGLFDTVLRRLDDLPLAYVHLVEPGISGALSAGANHGHGAVGAAWARQRTRHPLITTGGYTDARAREVVQGGHADAVGFGRLYLANPDLSSRVMAGAEVNAPIRETFYGGGNEGYIDYPSMEAQRALTVLRRRLADQGWKALPAESTLGPGTPVERWPLAWAIDRLRRDQLDDQGHLVS